MLAINWRRLGLILSIFCIFVATVFAIYEDIPKPNKGVIYLMNKIHNEHVKAPYLLCGSHALILKGAVGRGKLVNSERHTVLRVNDCYYDAFVNAYWCEGSGVKFLPSEYRKDINNFFTTNDPENETEISEDNYFKLFGGEYK